MLMKEINSVKIAAQKGPESIRAFLFSRSNCKLSAVSCLLTDAIRVHHPARPDGGGGGGSCCRAWDGPRLPAALQPEPERHRRD
jgi:hypothetical protein